METHAKWPERWWRFRWAQWPKNEVAVTQMSLAQLRLLLEGFELPSRRGWRRYEKRMSKPPVKEIVTRDL